MLHVLLLILKIILWIILGALGLVLVGILLLLFAPITYKVDAEYKKTARIKAKIRFLIISLRLVYNQETKEFNQDVRIAGIKLGKKNAEKAYKAAADLVEDVIDTEEDVADDETVEHETGRQTNEDTVEDDVAKQTYGESGADDKLDMQANEDTIADGEAGRQTNEDMVADGETDRQTGDEPQTGEKATDEEITDEQNGDNQDEDKSVWNEEFDLWDNDTEDEYKDAVPSEDKKLIVRVKKAFKGFIGFIKKLYKFVTQFTPGKIIENIDEKLDKIKKKTNRIKKFWNLECTVKTRKYLKKYIISIFKHIRPRKIKGYVHYGFEEPYKTGQITGYLSLMPFVYQKGFSLEPDFYNKVLEGHIYMRGHIQIGYLLRIVFNINLWRTLKVIKKLTNKA